MQPDRNSQGKFIKGHKNFNWKKTEGADIYMIKYFWPLVGLLAILSMIEIINYLNLNQIGIELVSIDPYWYGNISIPDDTPINSTPEYNQSHEWYYIPSNQSWSVRPKFKGGSEEEKEIIETKLKSSNKQSIHLFSTSYLESYEITCTDNETILCPFIDYKIIKDKDGNWNNTVFNITVNNTVIEKESELGSSNITVKSSYPIKLDNEFALAVPVESKIIKGEKNLKPTFEAGDKIEYSWEIPPNTRWAKFGENSITIIQASTWAVSAYLVNMTAEAGNFTHLNISTASPYDSLVGYWSFDADNGNQSAYDFAGNNNGAYVGNAWSNSTCGLYGNGACFDGSGDYLTVGTGSNFSNVCLNGCTFGAWAKKLDGVNWGSIITRYNTNNNDRFFRLGIDSGEDTRFLFYENGNDTSCNIDYTSSDILLNTWYFYIGVYTNVTGVGNISLYRNGEYLTSATCPFSGINITAWQDSEYTLIGAIQSSAGVIAEEYWNGSIDDVMIFNTSLTAEQITAIYNNQSARYMSRGEQKIALNLFQNGSINRLNVSTTIQELKDSNISLRVGLINASFNTTGLVGYWNAEDGAAQDFSGNNNHGTLTGNAFVNSTGGRNETKGFSFDGNGDYVRINDIDSVENINQLSVSAWVKTPLATSTTHTIINKIGLGADTFGFYWSIDEDIRFSVENSSDNAFYGDCMNGLLNNQNQWHHFVGVYNGTQVMCYRDAVLDVSGISLFNGFTDVNTHYIGIGADSDDGDYSWNGTIDDVMIFNRSLSATEILNLYTNQSANHDSNLYYENESYTKINNGTTQFNINTEAGFGLLEYQFNGNFYSPIIEGDISYEAWTEEEAGEDTTAPTVTLNSPDAGYYNDTLSNTYFNCTASDASGIQNISLWLTNNSNSSFSFNLTNTTSETLNTINATYNLSIGNYTWNCEACDTLGYCGFGINRTVEMRPLYIPPADSCTPTVGQSWTITHNCTKSSFSFSNPTYPIIIQDGSLTMNTYTNITAKYLNISQSVGYLRFNKSRDSRINLTG